MDYVCTYFRWGRHLGRFPTDKYRKQQEMVGFSLFVCKWERPRIEVRTVKRQNYECRKIIVCTLSHGAFSLPFPAMASYSEDRQNAERKREVSVHSLCVRVKRCCQLKFLIISFATDSFAFGETNSFLFPCIFFQGSLVLESVFVYLLLLF